MISILTIHTFDMNDIADGTKKGSVYKTIMIVGYARASTSEQNLENQSTTSIMKNL